jgi:hypothetical protein
MSKVKGNPKGCHILSFAELLLAAGATTGRLDTHFLGFPPSVSKR